MLKDFLLSQFPSSISTFDNSSLSMKSLSSLASGLAYLQHVSDEERTTINSYKRTVDHSPELYKALLSMINDPNFARAEDTKPVRGQHPRKKSRAMSRSEVPVNIKAFHDMDVTVPKTREQAEDIASDALRHEREVFMVCRRLHHPSCAIH